MSNPDLQQLSTGFADIAERAASHLVRIRQPRDRRARALSGVVLDDHHLVTSSRALRRDADIYGVVGDLEFELEVIGRDAATDVAVLRHDGAPPNLTLQPPSWRHDAPRVGEVVLTLARPGQTVRAALGVVSVVGGAFRSAGGTPIDHYLELDRDLPQGFFGGLVADAAGRGIGVALPGLMRGATVALPSMTLAQVASKLQQHGHIPRGYLGVGVAPARLPTEVADEVGHSRGVAIIALEESGPGAAAGLCVGDVIISVDGHDVASALGLRSKLLDRGGDTIDLKVLRASKTEDLLVTVGTRA